MLLAALGNLFIPLAPAGLPLIALGCLVIQQLVADSAMTVYDITEVSVRQIDRAGPGARARVRDVLVVATAAQLWRRSAPGCWPRRSGCARRPSSRPLGALLAACGPVGVAGPAPARGRRSLDTRTPAEVVVDVERDQPLGA